MHITKHGGLGWKRDTPDPRDYHYTMPTFYIGNVPTSVDLRPHMPTQVPLDQGDLGSCVFNGVDAALMFLQKKQNETVIPLSRLFGYYNVRKLEGTVHSDAGAQIRDAAKLAHTQGYCPENEWPYVNITTQFTKKPPKQCYTDAIKYESMTYQRVGQTLQEFQVCLASGYPILIGISVFPEFESQSVANTGIVPMPSNGEAPLGGHCMLVCGYDTTTQRFTTLNSWGSGFGDKGYVYLPYGYVLDPKYGGDFWTIQSVR
jgi:C1A family cysteine protease